MVKPHGIAHCIHFNAGFGVHPPPLGNGIICFSYVIDRRNYAARPDFDRIFDCQVYFIIDILFFLVISSYKIVNSSLSEDAMHAFTHLDKTRHGTPEFPAEYYYVDSQHPRYQMPFHWHNEWEILRVLDGSLQFHIDNEQYCAQSGDIVLIRGGVLHGGIPNSCVYECFVFDLYGLFRTMDMVKKSLRPFYRQILIPHCLHSRGCDDSFLATVNELMAIYHEGSEKDCKELLTIACLGKLFATILKLGLYSPAPEKNISNHRIGQIKTVLEYIEANYGSSISLDSLATVAGMNPKYFCRVFHSLTHQSPMEYVNFYRIELAAYQLDNIEKSITVIGSECGFAESSYFTKVFKKYKGVTPKEYRRNTTSL